MIYFISGEVHWYFTNSTFNLISCPVISRAIALTMSHLKMFQEFAFKVFLQVLQVNNIFNGRMRNWLYTSFEASNEQGNYLNTTIDSGVINARKRRNAISLVGLFATWIMEIIYVVIGGFLATFIKDGNLLGEIIGLILPIGFYLVPLIQIQTTPSIKSFINK